MFDMQTIHVTVGPDGRVVIPGTRPGETLAIQIEQNPETPERLTLATARTDEERDAVAARILRRAQELRQELGIGDDERLSLTHGDLLYDEDGLPR
jgi:bifunctional DNA-binding transcriptional regulator/antitoxin component of YhaV-PrlF toxin-antitoxin module